MRIGIKLIKNLSKNLLFYVILLTIGGTCLAADQEILEVLPPKNLYDAPIADPRWPKFLMGLSHDFKGDFGKTLWIFNFGEDIGLVKFGNPKYPYEFGVQAGAFGVMDISTEPTQLVNTDYFVALEISHVHDKYQHLLQIFHQSSHVGDEFLLSPQAANFTRINLSYEMLKYFLRYKHSPYFSPYATAGCILHVDPNHVKRLAFSAGVDLYSKKIVFKDSMRIIAGGFINSWEENNFSPSITVRVGLQYERVKYCNRFLQLLLQYEGGKSQQGQFYGTNIQQFGILIAFSS